MKYLTYLPLLALSLLFLSCKKDDSAPDSCRISSIQASNGELTQMTYNGQGQLLTLNQGASQYTYEHTGNTTIIRHSNGMDSVSMNSEGHVTNIRYHAALLWTNVQYNRHSNGELSTSVTTYNDANIPSVTTTYSYTNGNLTAQNTAGGAATSYAYNVAEQRKQGDYFDYLHLTTCRGMPVYKVNNLLEKVGNHDISYEYDADGKVSVMTVRTANGSFRYSYTYLCN